MSELQRRTGTRPVQVKQSFDDSEGPPLHDAAFKRVFRRAETIRLLVEKHAPEHAGDIDFATLEPVGGERLGEALARRYADAVWTARSPDGATIYVFLAEFQRDNDPRMALRFAVYALLVLQELLERLPKERKKHPTATPVDEWRVECFLIHHGPGEWRSPTRLDALFPHWSPGEYRVISAGRRPRGSARLDLVEAILLLESDQSAAGTTRALDAIRAVAEASGSEYDRFLAECIGVMLSSTGRITDERAKGASTMGRMSAEYRRSLEEWARPRVDAAARRAREEARREGRREGRYEAQVEMLRQWARDKFGAEAAESLESLLNGPDDQARVAAVSRAIVECDSAAAFLERARRSSAPPAHRRNPRTTPLPKPGAQKP